MPLCSNVPPCSPRAWSLPVPASQSSILPERKNFFAVHKKAQLEALCKKIGVKLTFGRALYRSSSQKFLKRESTSASRPPSTPTLHSSPPAAFPKTPSFLPAVKPLTSLLSPLKSCRFHRKCSIPSATGAFALFNLLPPCPRLPSSSGLASKGCTCKNSLAAKLLAR